MSRFPDTSLSDERPSTMSAEIDVRYDPDHECPPLRDGRPQLTWGHHPIHGNGWTLWYPDDPDSPTFGVEEYFIPGDVTDVDEAVRSATRWLAMAREGGVQ